MNKKWSSDKVREVQRWLIERWPDIFTPGPDLPPLSLKIHREILKYREENSSLSGRTVREVLNRHTGRYGYLYGMMKKSHRTNLDGKPVEPISVMHRQWARSKLRAMQKEAQKERKEKGQNMSQSRTPVQMQRGVMQARRCVDSANDRVQAKSPIIRYKKARRRMVQEAARVELVG